MKICVDLDDVIRDFVPEVIKEYNNLYHTNYTMKHANTWQINEYLNNIIDFRKWITEHEHILLNAKPIPKSIETMCKWKEDGHIIYIATNQFPGLEPISMNWLLINKVPYDGVFFGKNKSILNGDVLIDDKISNLNAFKKRKILINKPWNQDYLGERVNSLYDLRETFNEK